MLAERRSAGGDTGDVRRVSPAGRVRGTMRVPGDKSISHRAALFNALADGSATITGFAPGQDCAATLACVRELGAVVERVGDTVTVRGVGARGPREPADVLDCGNSGTTARLLCGALAGAGIFAVLTGDASLRRRPMARVTQPLRAMGASIAGREGGRLPLALQPAQRLRGCTHQLPVASAQVKSALLLAGLGADGATSVVEPAPSRDHTERLLGAMGADIQAEEQTRITVRSGDTLRATDVVVPGDFSSAAFWLALACLHPDAELRVTGVGLNPTRTGLLDVLRAMGADVQVDNQRDAAGEPVGDLVARSSRLRGTTVAGALVPLAIDELPLVALLGLFADGETVVRDAAELRLKESDRIAVVADGLRALGGAVTATADGWRITGGARLKPGRVHSHGDHRVAMVFALAGALGAGAAVEGAGSVAVSYPDFWQRLDEVAA